MTTALTSREKAVIVIQYLANLPFPIGTLEDYLHLRFARFLSFYHKRFFPEISAKTLVELCIEVRHGMDIAAQTLNIAVKADPSYANGGFGIDKPLGVHDINLNAEQVLNTDAISLFDALKAENLTNLKKEKNDKNES